MHPVPEAPEPCHLIELRVTGPDFDVGEVTQAENGVPRESWQAPWDEQFLDPDRVVFFFHHLDPSRPLSTPSGAVDLPPESPRPSHLEGLEYEQP